MVLAEDLVIPKGTVFRRVDGWKREYVNGNFEALISLSPDLTASVVLPEEALASVVHEQASDADAGF